MLEQIVPSRVCFSCDVCCRFPERDSALRPYFTRDEIKAAIASGVSPDAFPDASGSKIAVVPHGEGFRCPAFDAATGQCGIYDARPLDCRLYPVAVMRGPGGDDVVPGGVDVVMGWDSKCPFIRDNADSPESRVYIERTLELLESEDTARVFLENPQLIGAFQDDVIVLRRLDRLSFESRIAAHAFPGDPLAAYSFPFHAVWRDLFTYEWAELEGHLCLTATNADGTFLALPPIGPDPCGPAMAQAFKFLNERNRNPAVTRIENVPEALVKRASDSGYRIISKGPDYLYKRDDLVGLRGDRYKSQRAAYNQCVAESRPVLRPFRPDDTDECLALFRRWRDGVKPDGGFGRHMAEDAESAHCIGLTHAGSLGLIGRVAEVGGKVAAYSFGYQLNPKTFCVLFEVTDRSVKGLPAYIFREFCRELEGYEFINAMDDSGLEGLRRAKLSYHPIKLLDSFILAK